MRETTKVGFVISMFPELHETFILRELAALERRGVDFEIYSLQAPRDPVTLPDAVRLMRERTHYGHLLGLPALSAFFSALLRHPLALLSCLSKVMCDQWRTPLTMIKSLAVLPLGLHFARVARTQGVTHLHSHWANVPSTVCWYLQQIEGWSWSAAIHGEDIFSPNPLLQRKLSSARFVAVCSGLFQKHLQTQVAPSRCTDIHCNYHGLDPAVWEATAQLVARERTAGMPLEILSIGRLVPTKGHDTLLHACHLLQQRGVMVQLKLVGTGPQENELRQLCQSLSLDTSVTFCGAQSFAEVLAHFSESDIFCLASVMLPGHPPDGIPNVLAEAMAFALPIVSTKTSAIPELVRDGVDGLLVEPQDPEALANAIEKLADAPLQAKEMGQSARTRVQALFDQDDNIDELLALFDRYLPSPIATR